VRKIWYTLEKIPSGNPTLQIFCVTSNAMLIDNTRCLPMAASDYCVTICYDMNTAIALRTNWH